MPQGVGKPTRWGIHGTDQKKARDDNRMKMIEKALRAGASVEDISKIQRDKKGQEMLSRAVAARAIETGSLGGE